MSVILYIMARFVEKQIKLIYFILRERIENKGFAKVIKRWHGDCKKGVAYDEKY
jgi:hypothetical protein